MTTKKSDLTLTIQYLILHSSKRNKVKPMTNHKINNTFTSPLIVRRVKSISIKLVQNHLYPKYIYNTLSLLAKTIIFRQFLLLNILSNTLSAFHNQMILLIPPTATNFTNTQSFSPIC